jgi:GTP diphosphokinase / guanosine-3',5'-bis(diphosphate) 3'-diphosphatase
MEDESGHEASDLRFVISVHNLAQLEAALRNLRRTPSVLKAQRAKIT